MSEARWLDAEAVAEYITEKRPEYISRFVKAGKLPPPTSYRLGRRKPLWDREVLDRWFSGDVASEHHAIIQGVADEIARTTRRRANRPQAPR